MPDGSGLQNQLHVINSGLKTQNAGVAIQLRGNSLCLSAILPSKIDGRDPHQQRVRIKLKATKEGIARAHKLAIKLASEKASNTFNWKDWELEKQGLTIRAKRSNNSVEKWVKRFKQNWWNNRDIRTTAQQTQAERTWNRINWEFRRIENQQATLTIKLLVAIAETTEAGSKSRAEFCKQAKALAKFADLRGIKELEAVTTKYKPKVRALPDEETLFELAKTLRYEDPFGWCFAALVTYGCRVSEVYSLKPDKDGTAQVLGIKQKGEPPQPRTALALPRAYVESLDLYKVSKPIEIESAEDYNSLKVKQVTDRFAKWIKKHCGHMNLQGKDLRHSWAIRSILESDIGDVLAAKSMGHAIGIHQKTYSAAIDKRDMAKAAKRLERN